MGRALLSHFLKFRKGLLAIFDILIHLELLRLLIEKNSQKAFKNLNLEMKNLYNLQENQGL